MQGYIYTLHLACITYTLLLLLDDDAATIGPDTSEETDYSGIPSNNGLVND